MRPLALLVSLGVAPLCFGQTEGTIEAKARHTMESAVCERIDFQAAGYTVRSSRVENPFAFLPWVRAARRKAESEISALVDGKPFSYETASGKALEIVEKNFNAESVDARLKIRVELVSVENCSDLKLDLVYRVYSTQIRPVLSGSPESRQTEVESPQTAAGQTRVVKPASGPVYLTPTGGYDFTNKAYGGGRLEITSKDKWILPFNSAVIEGEGSSAMRRLSATVEGSKDSEGWLAHSEWLLNYFNYSLPTGAGEFKGAHLSGQFSGTTKAYADGNISFRFGAHLEGGNRQSSVRDLPLAAETLADAGFGSFKTYVGLYSRLPHNILSASYGLELGAVGPAARVDWRKHVGDIRHEFWYPVGDHRILSLESRLTAGRIQVPRRIPLSERFFGGSNEQLFIPGESWEIRANPVIRAIPASEFYRIAGGAGGKRFVSYNLTAAYAVWRKPLVPREITTDEDFKSELEGAITTVTSTLQNYYAAQDGHFNNVVGRLPKVKTALEDLKQKVATSQAAHPDESTALFAACTKAVNGALRRVNSAIDPQGGEQYGLVTFVLSDDPTEIQIVKATAACGRDLNAAVGDPSIAAASAGVSTLRDSLLAELNRVDQQGAEAKAKSDMAFTRRTLKTLFEEVNIYSVSPVFVFDVAKIGPARQGLGGVRYGPGAGIRLELATVANFTAGYAWNVRRGPGEGTGNVFFSISVRDLFH
ncbi:MAG TPA: hypothetical protein VGP08_21700 [Pyrinomonadaceae bacterium]|jgi:hypothetical protein|nr:hypothetical protein [Pyrinomonadaceae bacterium]